MHRKIGRYNFVSLYSYIHIVYAPVQIERLNRVKNGLKNIGIEMLSEMFNQSTLQLQIEILNTDKTHSR